MSVSNINNTTPNQVPWANLSANTITCNTVTCANLNVTNPVSVRFPIALTTVGPPSSQNLAIANADGSATSAVQFNLSSNPFPSNFAVGTGPSVKILETGKYIVSFDLSLVSMANTADSFGIITAVFKRDNGDDSYIELEEQSVTFVNSTTQGNYLMSQIINVTVANTNVQVLFRRGNAATNAGTIILSDNPSTGVSILKLA